MYSESTLSLHQMADLTCRETRQAFYLAMLRLFPTHEVHYFLQFYNEVAMNRSVTPALQQKLSKRLSLRPVDALVSHFVHFFEQWQTANAAEDWLQVQAYYPLLEDLNIAALVFHRKVCLDHARQMNEQMKASQNTNSYR